MKRPTLYELEGRIVWAYLKRLGFNQTAAAAELGITRKTLYSKIRVYGFKLPGKPELKLPSGRPEGPKVPNTLASRIARSRRKAAGQCLHCTTPRAEGLSLCARHHKSQRQRAKARYRQRALAGLCVVCEEPTCPDSKAHCRKHFEKNQVAGVLHRRKKKE